MTGLKVAVLIMLITFVYLFSVTFLPMTSDGVEQAKTITPFLLGTVIGTLIGYYYGNKHDNKPPLISKVDQDAIDTAKVKAALAVAMNKKEEVKDEEVYKI